MSQRRMAALLALPLLLVLLVMVAIQPLPYVTYSPGPTVDILGHARRRGDRAGLRARGLPRRRRAPPDHDLRRPAAGARDPRPPRRAPGSTPPRRSTRRSAVYAPDETDETNDTESAVQMVSSQDAAVATALTELGYDVQPVVEVLNVEDDYPAAGKLRGARRPPARRRHRDRDAPGRRRGRRRGPGRQAARLHGAPRGRAGGPRRSRPEEFDGDKRIGITPGPGLHLPLRGQRRHRRRHRRAQRRPDVLAGHLRHPHPGLAHRR